MITIKIKLEGLACIACKKVAEKRISTINGVKNVIVDLKTGETLINGNRDITKDEISAVLADTDYKIVS